MSDLIFAIPWWLFGSLILVGGIVFWTGMKQQEKNPMYVGVVLVLLAFGLKGLSYFVETDKERCQRQSTELATSVEKHDWVKFASLLDEDVTLGTSEGTIFSNRQKLIDGAKADTDRYDPKNIGIHLANVEQDQTGITVDMDVSAEASITMGYRIPTSWKLLWQRSGKEWLLHEITCTKIGNSSASQMAHDIGK